MLAPVWCWRRSGLVVGRRHKLLGGSLLLFGRSDVSAFIRVFFPFARFFSVSHGIWLVEGSLKEPF